jgi:protein phosphatase
LAAYRDFAGGDPQQALNAALQAAHDRVRRYSFAHPELRGMGTTCTAAAIVGQTQGGAQYDALYYAHVGDSRLYLIRDRQIKRLTRDHSYVGRLVESGAISPEEAETHPQRNILTAALGADPDLVVDAPAQPEPLRAEDVILICSDGLWGVVRDPELLAAVENKSAEQAVRELIQLARERGGPDNITVSVLRLR